MLQQARKAESAGSRQHERRAGHAQEAEPERGSEGPAAAPRATEADASSGGALARWLCEDDATPEPGQLRRCEFLPQLERRVRQSVEAALASEGACAACPYLDFWFGHYRDESAEHLRRVIARYAPDAARAPTASEALELFAARAAEKARRWLATGQVEGFPTAMDANHASVLALRSGLGDGRPLDLGTRARFEPVLGHTLAHVRIHADARGDRAAKGAQARAVAVGSHVAFQHGAFMPGTPSGDALLAHELAHTAQQRRGDEHEGPVARAKTLEAQADLHAYAAVARLWGDEDMVADAGPLTESGLSLRRCEDVEVACAANSGTVTSAFATAQQWVATALERCRSTPPHANVAPALRGAFRTDSSRLPEVIRGLTAIQTELAARHQIWCPGRGPACGPTMEGQVNAAFVRGRDEGQLGGPIFFCPTFFGSGYNRPLTVVHEACHLSPGFYPDVTYWGRDNYNSQSTDSLLRNADSYAVFVYWVVNGSAPSGGTGAR